MPLPVCAPVLALILHLQPVTAYALRYVSVLGTHRGTGSPMAPPHDLQCSLCPDLRGPSLRIEIEDQGAIFRYGIEMVVGLARPQDVDGMADWVPSSMARQRNPGIVANNLPINGSGLL